MDIMLGRIVASRDVQVLTIETDMLPYMAKRTFQMWLS